MRRWTDEEEKFLLENWGKLSPKQIADILGRTKVAVMDKYHYLTNKRWRKIVNQKYLYSPFKARELYEVYNTFALLFDLPEVRNAYEVRRVVIDLCRKLEPILEEILDEKDK